MKLSGWLYRHPRSRLAILIAAPMAWLVLAYLGSLTTMFLSAFWSVDSFTGKVIKNFSFANFQTLFTQSVYARLALRSLSVALIVTVIDALLAKIGRAHV